MPAKRKPLSNKQEKILVQAQLMGLTPADMQQIGNRLIAIQKEQAEIREIDLTVAGYRWEKVVDNTSKDDQVWWKIYHPDGYLIEASNIKIKERGYYSNTYYADLRITKPGTRYQLRRKKEQQIRVEHDWKKRLMPEQNKILYGIIRWAKYNSAWDDF